MNDNETDQEEQINGSIGARLKRAREKLELSVQDIAKQLRLKPERIEALEKDDYEEMANATFIKGYLRSYALLVHVPPEEILAIFDQLKPIPEARLQPLISKTQSSSLQDKPIRWGAYLVGLTLLILVGIWWNSVSAPDTSSPINPTTGMPQPIKNSPTTTGTILPAAPSVMQTAPVPTTPTNTPTPSQPTATPNTATTSAAATGLPMGVAPAEPEKKSSEQASSNANNDSATDASENDAATEVKQKKSSRRNRDTQYYNDGYNNQSSSYSDGYDSYE